MPRPRRPGAPEPKKRSRKGCWPCKARKVKCGEEKPICLNCQRQGEACDYSVRLNWGGRTKRATDSPGSQSSGYGGVVIGFADATPTDVRSPIQFPPSGSNILSGGFVHVQSSEPGHQGTKSPSTPEHFHHSDQTNYHQRKGDADSPQTEAPSASTWKETSSLTAPTSPGPLPKFPFHGSFSPVADRGVGLRSFSAFPFHANAVSQQVSFLRNSVNNSDHQPNLSDPQDENPGQRRTLGSQLQEDYRHGGECDQPDFPGMFSSANEISSMASAPLGALSSITTSHASPSPSQDGAATSSSHGVSSEFHRVLQQGVFSNRANEGEQETNDSSLARSKWQAYLTSVTDNYGLDSGRPDLDLTLNNDHAAIDINSATDTASVRDQNDEHEPSEPLAMSKDDFSGYYTSPVPINLPRSFAPLPSALLENPINLMYFHHFLNHTSRMLVPHDCDYNPFMSVLPSMAIGDPNLLNLLLAYSASHRARYLGHPEPANRIAHWVSDVFPALRVALESPHEDITDGHLATAILLLSLKIVSPGTFEVPITWQSHLKLARDLFFARSERIAFPNNRIGSFFARWLGYIDIMGALSSRQAGPPLMLYHSVLEACSGPGDHDEHCVDCFTGFTPRTGYFLIRLARLVQQCDNQRFDEFGNFRQGWHPSADIVMEAQAILGDIDDLSERVHANPDHHQGIESQDMMAIEESFRSAGLLHLHRRVLGSSADSYPVQDALRKLLGALGRMRLGASTEVCSLFPLFTAGCESRDQTQQVQLLNRFLVLEKSGMKQIQNARQLMQQCWDDKLPWIALASGQFLG